MNRSVGNLCYKDVTLMELETFFVSYNKNIRCKHRQLYVPGNAG